MLRNRVKKDEDVRKCLILRPREKKNITSEQNCF